ncbi:MAG: SIS domain-containing protein [Gemmatimonadetes bacterium]|nr:SIS domain-containing protein [Gemmatimonadota bacterium]
MPGPRRRRRESWTRPSGAKIERLPGTDGGASGALEAAASAWSGLVQALLSDAAAPLERLIEACVAAIGAGDRLYFAGNGGSAAQSQHLAAELVVREAAERYDADQALGTDTSVLTATANDLGFDRVFARQLEALGRPGDVLVLLSANGRSPNVAAAAATARARGVAVWAWTGRRGTRLVEACDGGIVVPSEDVARIQEAHLLLGHVLCAQIEGRLSGR